MIGGLAFGLFITWGGWDTLHYDGHPDAYKAGMFLMTIGILLSINLGVLTLMSRPWHRRRKVSDYDRTLAIQRLEEASLQDALNVRNAALRLGAAHGGTLYRRIGGPATLGDNTSVRVDHLDETEAWKTALQDSDIERIITKAYGKKAYFPIFMAATSGGVLDFEHKLTAPSAHERLAAQHRHTTVES